MQQTPPLFDGNICHEYSSLLAQENALLAMDQEPPRPKDETDDCTPPTESLNLQAAAEKVCEPSSEKLCDDPPKQKYAFPAVQSGWAFPPQPHA